MSFIEILPTSFSKPKRWIRKVFIHCSASDTDHIGYQGVNLAHTINRWHKERGWNGIGYHYVIDKQGILVTGRDIGLIPAAQAGHNKFSIAICVHGLDINKFTEEQFDTLRKLCYTINKAYGKKLEFKGHCEVSSKLCPVFDYKEVLNLDVNGRLI